MLSALGRLVTKGLGVERGEVQATLAAFRLLAGSSQEETCCFWSPVQYFESNKKKAGLLVAQTAELDTQHGWPPRPEDFHVASQPQLEKSSMAVCKRHQPNGGVWEYRSAAETALKEERGSGQQ